jgi:hypothetical protein
VLTVTRIDRLAHPIGDLQDIVATSKPRGASLQAMEQPIDTIDTRGEPALPICVVRHLQDAERHMPTIRQIVFGLVIAVGILFPGQVLAERAPHPGERSRIETMLRNEGYTHWGKIEFDDNDEVWEVDNAYASDGHRYDLRLDPDTLRIMTREPY